MNLKMFFYRSDVRIIIVGTVTGGLLQILAKKYIKNHPKFLKDLPKSKEIIPRGGEIVSGSAVLAHAILSFLAEYGLLAGVFSSVSGLLVSKIPVNLISTYLHESVPQNLSHLEKKNLH